MIIHLFKKMKNLVIQGIPSGIYMILIKTPDTADLGTSTGYLKFRPEDFEKKAGYSPKPFISKIRVDNNVPGLLHNGRSKVGG